MKSQREIPDWQSFAYKYRGREQDVFEDLARILFCKEMGIHYGLFQRVNHAGNETDIIKKDEKVIGFQAKYFKNGINADNIIHSMREAKAANPEQTHYYIYCNCTFGNPRRVSGDKDAALNSILTRNETRIINEATRLGLDIVWKLDKAILDEACKEKWICDVFFDTNGKLEKLINEEKRHAEIAFNSVKYDCVFNGKGIHINRDDILSIIAHQNPSTVLVIRGDGGCGKTAILHEFLDKYGQEIPICYRKATSLNVTKLVEVFYHGDFFTFSDFKDAFSDCENKYFIIDSAEHLDEIEDGTIVPALLKGLLEDHWRIVITVRNVFASDLLNYLTCELHDTKIANYEVGLLSESALRLIARDNGILLPKDSILLDRVRNLFYLALYTQYYHEIDSQFSDSAFLKLVWDKKIKGKNSRKGYLRENEFEAFIKDRMRSGAFFLPPQKYTSEEFHSLISDEIIAIDPTKGLFITHDIFEEWGMYRIVDCCWEESISVSDFLNRLGDTRSIRRAFRLWVKDKVEESPDSILEITKAAFTEEMPGQWNEEVLCALLLSSRPERFFACYEEQLLNNSQGFADKIIWALRTGCQYVKSVLEYKDYYIPVYVPTGGGWEYIIDLLFRHQKDVRFAIWLPLLSDWAKGNLRGMTTRKVGLMVITYSQTEAYRKEKYKDDNKKLVHEIINNTVFEVKEELSALFKQCISGISSNDDLPEFVITENLNALKIHFAIPEGVVELCSHYWRQEEDDQHRKSFYFYDNNVFGIDERFRYFPPGADQTPIASLLKADENTTIDFIIRLMNECTDTYSKAGADDSIIKVLLSNGKEKHNWQWHCWALWGMYRGTGTPVAPDCLVSMHMALERHLLNLSKNRQFVACQEIMDRLLYECHSSSVSAIVCSLVLAYPNEYWQIALVLFRTLAFIQIDSHRALMESQAKSLYEISSSLHPDIYKERMETCEQEFRRSSLENVCLNYQFFGSTVLGDEDNNAFVEQINGILDEHRESLNHWEGDDRLLMEILVSRIDRRRLKIRGQEKVGEKIAIQFETELGDGARKMSVDSSLLNQEITKYVGLLNWAIAVFKNESLENSPYSNNLNRVIEDVQALQKDLDNGREGFITDSRTPVMVCASLLKAYRNELTENTLKWCKEIVEKRLSELGNWVVNSIDGTIESIYVLPILIGLFPNEHNKYEGWLIRCLSTPDYGNISISSCAITAIRSHGLWMKDASLMKRIVRKFTQQAGVETAQPFQIKGVLGLVPDNPDQEISGIAIKYLEQIPSLIANGRDSIQGMFSVLDTLAYLFMHTESSAILDALSYTFPIVTEDYLGDSYLLRIILEADACKNPDRFWLIWKSFLILLPELIKRSLHSQLKVYMLNIQWKDDVREWHSLRKEDLGVFAYIAEHSRGNTIILEGLAEILLCIGSHFKTEGMSWMSRVIEQNPNMNLSNTKTLRYLEYVMLPYVYVNKSQIRKNPSLLSQVRTILSFMVSKSSVTGYMLRDMVS